MSTFSRAIASVESADDIDLSKAFEAVSIDRTAKTAVKEDIKLVKELQDERVPQSSDVDRIPTSNNTNRYALWQCGFGFAHEATSPSSIPSTKVDFLKAVKGELTTLAFIKTGLRRYIEVLNSGEHAVFSQTFLDTQNKSTQITLEQLDQIEEHLDEVVNEIGEVEDDGQEEVKVELQEVFSHAKPWITRTRAIMISSHVFYKTNYALAADARKDKTEIS